MYLLCSLIGDLNIWEEWVKISVRSFSASKFLGKRNSTEKKPLLLWEYKGTFAQPCILVLPLTSTWTSDINVDIFLSGWGTKRDMSQINESSLCVSQLFLSQQVMASMTVCAVIFTETVAGFYLTNCVVTLLCFWQSLSVQIIWVELQNYFFSHWLCHFNSFNL